MELRRLRYFVTVVDEGSISAAARKLYMSQPPLSAQLRLLEQEVGCPLLERGARKRAADCRRAVLYERARELLELEQSARQEVQACGVPAEGTVRLGVVSSVASTRLPGWLAGFAAEHPLVRLQLVERDTFGLLELLRRGGCRRPSCVPPARMKGWRACRWHRRRWWPPPGAAGGGAERRRCWPRSR